MKTGKISESILKRSVFKPLENVNKKSYEDKNIEGTNIETTNIDKLNLQDTKKAQTKKISSTVLKGPAISNDAGIIESEGHVVVSTNTTTVDFSNKSLLAELAINRSVNGIIAEGAKPKAITVDLLIPTVWNEAWLRELVTEHAVISAKLNVPIINGHTQVIKAISSPIITVTALGNISPDKVMSNKNIKPGMDVIMTGYAGAFGTAVLALEKAEELRSRYSQPFLDKAVAFRENVTSFDVAKLITSTDTNTKINSEINSETNSETNLEIFGMHDISEGGVFAALWEMAQAAGVGLDIYIKDIPIKQETIEICEFFDINPYKFLSTGTMLIIAKDGNSVIREIEKNGGRAAIIGVTTSSNDRVLIQGEERRFLETAQIDEIYKVYQN